MIVKLTRKNMEMNGNYTMDGIERMQVYKQGMNICSTLFLTYDSEWVITEDGTCGMETLLDSLLAAECKAAIDFWDYHCYNILSKRAND